VTLEDGSALATDPTTTSLVRPSACLFFASYPSGADSTFSSLLFAGRIRKGPAPLNLEVPQYSIDGEAEVITVG
jgi:hypothetical protein